MLMMNKSTHTYTGRYTHTYRYTHIYYIRIIMTHIYLKNAVSGIVSGSGTRSVGYGIPDEMWDGYRDLYSG